MAEMSDYWLYSMNAPFGRTRGGEPDSPYNGFCTITHFQICRGLDQVRGLANTHNGEPRAGGRRRGRGNRRRRGTRPWRFLWRWSRRRADPDMVVRGTRLQPRLCSRIGAPPTPVVRSPPRGHATPSRRRPPASTATCRPPSARLPTSVRTQAPSRFHHRRVIPRHGWRTRGRAVPSAQHPVRARRWRGTGPRG